VCAFARRKCVCAYARANKHVSDDLFSLSLSLSLSHTHKHTHTHTHTKAALGGRMITSPHPTPKCREVIQTFRQRRVPCLGGFRSLASLGNLVQMLQGDQTIRQGLVVCVCVCVCVCVHLCRGEGGEEGERRGRPRTLGGGRRNSH
jgi:hypothetical protein